MRSMLIACLLFVSLAFAPAAFASSPAINSATVTQPNPMSTGVTPVKLLHHPKYIDVPSDQIYASFPEMAMIELRVHVTRNGHTGHVRILHSDDPVLDAYAMAAVHEFHWRPARLDHRHIGAPVDVTLMINQ